jgi:predicted RNA polymerase sigma factor
MGLARPLRGRRGRDSSSVRGMFGPYALQDAIAACHARARTAEETDWERIAALYEVLARLAPSPIVELNRAVALSMAFGPATGLELVDALTTEPSLKGYHLLPSVRGDLLAKLARPRRGVRARGIAHPKRTRAHAVPQARGNVRAGVGTAADAMTTPAAFYGAAHQLPGPPSR